MFLIQMLHIPKPVRNREFERYYVTESQSWVFRVCSDQLTFVTTSVVQTQNLKDIQLEFRVYIKLI